MNLENKMNLTKIFAIIFSLYILIACQTQTPAESTDPKDINETNLVFIIIGDSTQQADTSKTIEKTIKASDNAWISLYHVGNDSTDAKFVFSRIIFPANTLDEDADVSLTVDSQILAGSIKAKSNGLMFKQSALLSLHANGLDFDALDIDDLTPYFLNIENGVWEEMVYEYLYVNKQIGQLYIHNGELPYFTRFVVVY